MIKNQNLTINDQILLDHNYNKFLHNDKIHYQKKFDDNIGIKYYLTCRLDDYTQYSMCSHWTFFIQCETKNGSVEIQTVQWFNDSETHLQNSISNVEDYFERVWAFHNKPYYEKYINVSSYQYKINFDNISIRKSDKNIFGSSFFGDTITTTPRILINKLGYPQYFNNNGNDKVNMDWVLETSGGIAFSLYDYKEYKELDFDTEYEFHIGGFNEDDTNLAKLELNKIC